MATLDWLIVAGYFAALMWIGWRERGALSGSAGSVILGGRSLTLPAFVATLVTTWYGGILAVGEYSYGYGISNWIIFGLPYYVAAAVFALVMAKTARRSQALTIPERIHRTIGKRSSIVAAILVFILSAPTSYLLGLAILVSFFFNISVALAALVSAVISLIYVMLGGFKAVVRTDKIQFVLMFGGFAILFFMLVQRYGFWEFISASVPETHLSWTGGASLWYIASWYIIAQGALVDPGFHQRCYAAKSESVAQRGILISIAFWALFDFLTTACGLYARALLPNLADGALSFPALALEVLPPVALGLFVTGMLSVMMSTIDSNSFLAATTFSYDFILRLKKDTSKPDEHALRRWTIIGLALSTALALLLALVFDSIVEVWREFGSVGIPALLAPLLIAFFAKKPRSQLSDKQGLILITLPALVSATWIIYHHLGPTGAYPFADYPFLSEPIFPGLYVSLALWISIRFMNTRNNQQK